MKLYEKELLPIINGKDITGNNDCSIDRTCLNTQNFCIGHIDQITMIHVCKRSKVHSFAMYLQYLIIQRDIDSHRFNKESNYSFVVDDVRVDDFAKMLNISKRMAYNYIKVGEEIGDIYNEGSNRYSLSFIYNPFIKKSEVIKQNKMNAILYYKNDPNGRLFINKEYGSFELSPWNKDVITNNNKYVISDNNGNLQSFILWWIEININRIGANDTYIKYAEISSMFSRKFQKVSVSKIRRVVKSMECDDVIRISLESFGNRKCYTINYDKIIK